MKDIMIGLAFMTVYVPLVGAYIMYADEVIDKVVDFLEKGMFPVKPEFKTHGELVAFYGEAVDA